jgi:hypothetical protein
MGGEAAPVAAPVPNWIYRKAQQRPTAATILETPNMKPSKVRRHSETRRLWTFEEAQAAVPYFSAVTRSLREHYLEMCAKSREVQKLRERQGRPDRKALIEEQEARRDLLKAEQDCRDVLEELSALGVQPLDALQGTALVPFVHDDESAWYIFDLFDSQPIRSWYYQSDLEQPRALTAP